MRMTSVMRRGSRLALLAGASLLALAAWVAVAGLAHANPAAVSVGSASVALGESATVGITITPGAGETVGSAGINVSYDAAVSPTACTPVATCNITYGANTVRLTLVSLSGLIGQVGTITFQAVGTGTASLTATAVCSDEVGAALTCTVTGGSITIAVPATPTATPTATPAAAPLTGGSPDGSGPDGWLLASLIGLGLVTLISGAWAVSRTRRLSL